MDDSLSHSFSTSNDPQVQNEDKSFSKNRLPRTCKLNKCSLFLLLIFLCILPIGISQYLQISSQHGLNLQNTSLSEPTNTNTPSEPVTNHSEHYHIRKPISDPNEYRYMTLENGLKVFIISDPTVQKSSAALVLNAGSSTNPPEIPGLAHLLEHVLAIGSKTYSLETYTNQIGGGAIISKTDTVYYGDTNPLFFEKALDIFADPFLNPRFDFEWYEPEVHRIDKEFNEHLGKAGRRFWMILRYLVDPESLLAQDPTGNYKTLHQTPLKQGINVSIALQDLFEKYYSANLMTLVVMHDQPLDEIQRIVTQSQFSKIPNKNRTKPNLDHFSLPLSDKNRYKILKHSDNTSEGSIIFQIYGVQSKQGPINFIRDTMERDHFGSLSRQLQERNLISLSILSNYFTTNSDCGIFALDFALSESGRSRFEEIIQIVFAYIHQLIHGGLTEDLYREYFYRKNYFFQYSKDPLKDFKDPLENARKFADFAEDLLNHSPDNFLSKFSGLSDDDHQILAQAKSILLQMNTHNLMLLRSVGNQTQDPGYEKYKTYDPVTKIEYSIENLPENLIKKWNTTTGEHYPPFKFSLENPFIPRNFDLVTEKNSHNQVQKINNNIWYGTSIDLETPKVAIYLKFPGIKSLDDLLLSKSVGWFSYLPAQTLNDSTIRLLEYSGNSVNFQLKYMKITAFSDSLYQILEMIPQVNTSFNVAHPRSRAFLSFFQKKLDDLLYYYDPKTPEEEALNLLFEMLTNHRCTSWPEIRKNVTKRVIEFVQNPSKYQSMIGKLLANPEFFIFGNISPEEAAKVADKLTSKIPKIKETSPPVERVLKIHNHNLIYRVNFKSLQNNDVFVLNYYQGGLVANATNIAFLDIFISNFEKWIYFNENLNLKAEIHLRKYIRGETIGFYLSAKSRQKDQYNQTSMNIFLRNIMESFYQTIMKTSQEQAEMIIRETSKNLIKSMRATSNSFDEKADEIFGLIDNQVYHHTRPEDVLESLEKTNTTEFLKFVDAFFKPCGKISLQGFPQGQDFSNYPGIHERGQEIIINLTDDLKTVIPSLTSK